MEEPYANWRCLEFKAYAKVIFGILLALAVMYAIGEYHDYQVQETVRQLEEESSQKIPAGPAQLNDEADIEVLLSPGMRQFMADCEPAKMETDASGLQASGTP